MTTSDPTAVIASARRHGVGDLLHRTARRYPGKLAVVAGDLRATYEEFDTAVNRAAHALTDRGLRPGDRLALLSHNCWQFAVVAFATAKLGVVLVPVNFMLTAPEVAYILRHSGARGIVAEDALVPTAEKALADAGVAERDPRLDRTGRRGGTRGLGRRRRLVAGRPRGGPGRAGGRRRPRAADVHLGHGVAPEGRPALEPLADQPVRQLRDRRRDERGRRRGPRAADVPLRAAGLLLLRRRLPRRDQRDPSRARPRGAARDDRAGAGHEALLPADRVDLAAAPPRLRRDGPVVAAQGLLRRLADADRGAARAAAAAPGRRAVELLRADRDGAAGDHPAPARAAGTGGQRGQGGDQRRDPGRRHRRRAGPAGHDRRDRAPQPARGARLLRGRGEDRRGVRGWLVPLR